VFVALGIQNAMRMRRII